MNRLVALDECIFRAERDDSGKYVGRCVEFPELRTRPHRNRLDAIDSIIDAVRQKIRNRDAAVESIRRETL